MCVCMHVCVRARVCYGVEEVCQVFAGTCTKRKEMLKLSPEKETATLSADSKGY